MAYSCKRKPMKSRLFAMFCEKEMMKISTNYFSTPDVDQTICEELKKCKNHLFYMADLYSKFNEIQKRLQSKDFSIIQARTAYLNLCWHEEILSTFQIYRNWKKEQMFHTYKSPLRSMWISTLNCCTNVEASVSFGLSAAVQPFLLAFPSSYLVEAGFSHANAISTKQRNRPNWK
ncbi:hypothetical protein T07_6721, partial [Trichinella nelsoni]